MTDVSTLDKRVPLCRLAVWLAILLLTTIFYRSSYPWAWQAAAFGALFSLLWLLVRRPSHPTPRTPASEEGAPSEARSDEMPASRPPFADMLGRAIDVGMDLLVITVLVNVSGGFQSMFAPLYFVAVLEAFALLGASAAIYAALAAVLLNLVHFRLGVTAQGALLYGVAAGTLLVCAVLAGWSQGVSWLEGRGSADSPRSGLFGGRRSTLMKVRTVETLEKELEELEATHRQLKTTYREVAQLHREQKSQIDHLRAAEQLFEASATTAIAEGDAHAAYSRLLHIVMDILDAGGGVLWLRTQRNDALTVQAAEGRVAPSVRAEVISPIAEMTPGDLRSLCEARLFAAAPASATAKAPLPAPQAAEPSAEGEEDKEASSSEVLISGPVAHPVAVALLREPATDAALPGGILGAVGLCDPRGATRFSQTDIERLQALAAPLAAALYNVDQRYTAQRRVREISLLYDLSRLVQSATDMEQIYQAIVAQVQRVIPYENCTLFLLDKAHSRLEAKATRGRVVNLLDHIVFEKGNGVSGWAAAHGKQVFIADLTRETNLLNIEMIPPRVRSFIAAPLRVQNNVVGVLNISHSQANAFTSDDLQLLTILASQAAITIERTEVFHALETLAITDGLTQVFNHRYFQMRLEDELRRGRRYSLALSLMLMDADNFKDVNDQYGHASGDVVLRELAALLSRSVRETEIVARYGGEEFALVLPQTGFQQAQVAAERVRTNIEGHTFRTLDGQPIRLTISIGVATYPLHGNSPAELIDQADRALYAAKRSGRNRVHTAAAPATAPPSGIEEPTDAS